MSSSSPEPLQAIRSNIDEDGDSQLKPQGSEEYHLKKMYKNSAGLKYMECLKNHAAHMGRSATDGCGEFIPGGEEGTIEALKCSACDCHRNFHRRTQLLAQTPEVSYYPPLMLSQQPSVVVKNNVSGAVEFNLGGSGHQMPMNPTESGTGNAAGKKRYRTMFTQEQKEKMLSFAEKANWKMPKIEDSETRAFCQEIGIKRKVLKVWMHNNKYQQQAKKNNDDNE